MLVLIRYIGILEKSQILKTANSFLLSRLVIRLERKFKMGWIKKMKCWQLKNFFFTWSVQAVVLDNILAHAN